MASTSRHGSHNNGTRHQNTAIDQSRYVEIREWGRDQLDTAKRQQLIAKNRNLRLVFCRGPKSAREQFPLLNVQEILLWEALTHPKPVASIYLKTNPSKKPYLRTLRCHTGRLIFSSHLAVIPPPVLKFVKLSRPHCGSLRTQPLH